MPKLYDLAHCRAGDKGDTSILSLVAYRASDYPLLVERVTSPRSRSTCAASSTAKYAASSYPSSARCNSSASMRSSGGVTTSLALDAHGKSLSSALLEMDIR